jgi:Fe-S-cluster containining protein
MAAGWERVGSCDGCVGRHPSAYCCTTIDASTIFGVLTPEAREYLYRPSQRKILAFNRRFPWDFVRFNRLHGLDGTVPVSLEDAEGGAIVVRIMLRTRSMEMWTDDGTPFWMRISAGDDVRFIVQLPCREYSPEDRRCKIYATRPKICRSFPSLPSQVADTPCAYRFRLRGSITLTSSDGQKLKLKPFDGGP